MLIHIILFPVFRVPGISMSLCAVFSVLGITENVVPCYFILICNLALLTTLNRISCQVQDETSKITNILLNPE